MDVIERLNRRFGGWYEGLFGTTSDRDLRPRDILRRLLTAMEDARREGLDGQVYVPNGFTLQISVADENERDYLRTFLSAEDLAAAVQRVIDQHGYRLKGGLSFQVEELPTGSGGEASGRVVIKTRFDPTISITTPTPPPPATESASHAGRGPAPTTSLMDEEDEDEPGTVVGRPGQVLASLIVRGGDGKLQEIYPVGPGGVRIGRSRKVGNDIVLTDGMVSKRHAGLVYNPGAFYFSVRDEGSTNGTFLNGTRLASGDLVPLRSGDQILVGETILTFRPTDDAPRETGEMPPAPAQTTFPAATAALSPLSLVTEDGVRHPIASEMKVGRAVTSDIVLNGNGVGSEHARLFRQVAPNNGGEERVYVEDLGTPGGTWVNGEQIPSRFPVALYDGDALVFGDVSLRVVRRAGIGGGA